MCGSEGRRAIVRLLGGEHFHVNVLASTSVRDLTRQVNSHCQLEAPDSSLFGLAFIDEKGNFHWLTDDRLVLECVFSGVDLSKDRLLLHHTVRFFVENVMTVEHPITVEFYFMEAHEQLLRGELWLPAEEYYCLAANLLHVYAGEFNVEISAVEVLRSLLPLASNFIASYNNTVITFGNSIQPCSSRSDVNAVMLEEIEHKILESYMMLKGTPRGISILRVMQIVERCATYGSRFYCVRDACTDEKVTLAINSKGVFVYDVGDYLVPKMVFEWASLSNIYENGKTKFTLEVKEKRRGAIENFCDLNAYLEGSRIDADDELRKAACDPTTQVSCLRRGAAPRGSCSSDSGPLGSEIFHFFCEDRVLCKTLWSSAICQHQFFVQQQQQKSRSTAHKHSSTTTDGGGNGFVSSSELSDKLNRLVSRSSIASSLPSLSSLHSNSSLGTMPSAKVADGSSCASLPSLKSAPSMELRVGARTEEEKARDLERYKVLLARKTELEERMVERISELRAICIQEGEVSGEMPKELDVILKPGEEAPKIKKRIGTGFQLSQNFLRTTKADAISQLEGDIELHRKIVSAADRLAKDKSMNKSVRKKRQKDLSAAAQKLRGLELQLSQMKFSASKPDVSSLAHSNQNTWTAGSSPASMRAMAKSCPTTPRGSVPDLVGQLSDYEDECDNHRPTSCTSSASSSRPTHTNSTNRFSEASTCSAHSLGSAGLGSSTRTSPPGGPQGRPPRQQSLGPGSPRSAAQRRATIPKSHTLGDQLDNPMAGTQQKLPLYENIGYRSCASYQSSYRQVHYPTLHDEHVMRQRAKSEHDLITASESNGSNCLNGPKDPPVISVANRLAQLKQESRPERGKLTGFHLSQENEDDDDLTPCGEQRFLGAPSHSQVRPRIPVSQSCQAGFSTASLDRRAVRTRLTPLSSPLLADTTRRDSLPSSQNVSANSSQRDASPATHHRITTFPVGTKGKCYETTKPYEQHRFASAPPQGRMASSSRPPSGHSATTRFPSNLSQPALPPFQHPMMRQGPSTVSTGRMPHVQTDPRMEALLDHYKKDGGRKPAGQTQKTATIV